ncbi:MAG TPA: hypothetical protein VLY23_18675 [Candidatus Acidoferrum sp.]|nr:hypothetical protein [Candidatus Acidoferrum sp.]
MSIHVKDGTPLHGPSLCDSCTHAHIEKGYRASEELIVCAANYPVHRVRFPIRECTSYLDRNRQDLEAMEKIAWILEPGGTKRRAGFVRATDAVSDEGAIELILNEGN